MIFGYDVFGAPAPVFFNLEEEVPIMLVKISANGIIEHKQHNAPAFDETGSDNEWFEYGFNGWEAYKNLGWVKGRALADHAMYKRLLANDPPDWKKYCFKVHESVDSNVPVGTIYGDVCICGVNSTKVGDVCECDEGYEYIQGICKPVILDPIECLDSNREAKPDGSCGPSCNDGYTLVKKSWRSKAPDLCQLDSEPVSSPLPLVAIIGGVGLLSILAIMV